MPYYETEFESPLSPPEVAQRLRGVVRSKRGFLEKVFTSAEERKRWPFSGSVGDGIFKVVRQIGYRNSFLPVVRGTYEMSSTGGTRVHLTMTLHVAVWIFEIIWFGLFVPTIVREGIHESNAILVVAFLAAVTAAAFFPEAIKARNILMRALDAKKAAG